MERVVFPIHDICAYLTPETKQSVYVNTERDAQGSKVTDFFNGWESLYEEMKWQRKLQDRKFLSACTKRLRFWGRLAFSFAILVNIIIATSYPFDNHPTGYLDLGSYGPFLYLIMLGIAFLLYTTWKDGATFAVNTFSQLGIFAFMLSGLLLLMNNFGNTTTLFVVGTLQVSLFK